MLRFRANRLILPLLLLIASVPAFAGGILTPGSGLNSWDLYAFGNGVVIANAFSSISSMVAMSGYTGLLKLLAVIGIISLAVAAGFDPGKHAVRFLSYLIVSYAIIWSVSGTNGGGGLTASLNIDDVVTQQVYNVNNVPAVIAVPAAVVSDIGQWLTQAMEQNFSYGNTTMAISDGGAFNMAAALSSDLTKIQIGNAGIAGSINYYMQDCVVPALANGGLYPGDLLTSTDLWATLQGADSQALLTTYIAPAPNSTAQVESCLNAYNNIKKDLTNYLPEFQSEAAGAWGNTGTGSLMAKEVTDATSWLTAGNIQNGGATQVEQAAVLNQMSNSFSNMAAITNNNAMVTSLALAQARQSQLSGWVAGSQVFQQMMGYVYAVLEIFIFGITPIILAAFLIPGLGASILKNFGQVLIWLALWNPMFAVVSFIMNSYAQADLSPLLQVTTQTNGTVWGLTAANVGAISTASSTMVAAGGFLGTMVPLIAWGLVKGQLAFTEFVTHGIGTSFANSAATEMATGNVSLGSQSIGLTNMNKFNSVAQTSVGMDAVQSVFGDGHAAQTYNFGGKGALVNNGQLSSSTTGSTGLNSAEQQARVKSATDTVKHDKTASDAQGTAVSSTLTNLVNQGDSTLHKLDLAFNAARGTTNSDKTDLGDDLSRKYETAHNRAAQLNADLNLKRKELDSAIEEEKNATTADGRAAAQKKISSISKAIGALTPGIDAAIGEAAKDVDAIIKAKKANHDISSSNDNGSKTSATKGDSTSDGTGTQLSQAYSAAATHTQNVIDSYGESLTTLVADSNTLQLALSSSVGTTTSTPDQVGDNKGAALQVQANKTREQVNAATGGKDPVTLVEDTAKTLNTPNPDSHAPTDIAAARGDASKHWNVDRAAYQQMLKKNGEVGESLRAKAANDYKSTNAGASKVYNDILSEVHAIYNRNKENFQNTATGIAAKQDVDKKELDGYMNDGAVVAAVTNGAALAYNLAEAAYDAKAGKKGAFAEKVESLHGKALDKFKATMAAAGERIAKVFGKEGKGDALAAGSVDKGIAAALEKDAVKGAEAVGAGAVAIAAGPEIAGGGLIASAIGLADAAFTADTTVDVVSGLSNFAQRAYDEYAGTAAADAAAPAAGATGGGSVGASAGAAAAAIGTAVAAGQPATTPSNPAAPSVNQALPVTPGATEPVPTTQDTGGGQGAVVNRFVEDGLQPTGGGLQPTIQPSAGDTSNPPSLAARVAQAPTAASAAQAASVAGGTPDLTLPATSISSS